MIAPAYFTPSHMPAMNDAVASFVSRICFGNSSGFDRYSTMGVFDGSAMIGGTVYHNWHPESGVMEISSASTSRRWLQPHVIRSLFSFPFDAMGAQMVVMRVSERNTGMVAIARRFGFDGVLIPRLRGRDEAEWVFRMTDDAWRAHPVAMRGKIG